VVAEPQREARTTLFVSNVKINSGVDEDEFTGVPANRLGRIIPRHVVLIGEDGDDHLTGGPWEDVLIGGRGNDGLRGRGGADMFVFSNRWAAASTAPIRTVADIGVDTVEDFQPGIDKIVLDQQ